MNNPEPVELGGYKVYCNGELLFTSTKTKFTPCPEKNPTIFPPLKMQYKKKLITKLVKKKLGLRD